MIPHPHAMDAQNRAQDLASAILAASAPSQIAAACAAVDAFLHKHPSDQTRSFFSIAFPVVICKLFGFNDSSPSPSQSSPFNGWIDQLDPDVACRVFDLLSPDGILFSTISSVDRHSLIRYVFPIERLPEWMRYVLQCERYCTVISDLCPLFKSRVKKDPSQKSCQIQLNVFEYFMFWFAYYPICKVNCENSNAVVVRKNRRFRLENWTSSWPVLSTGSRRSRLEVEGSLYLRLLYAYLRAFVPKFGLVSYQPYRSSLLHYSSNYDGLVVLQAEFLVFTLIHFWMVDNDFSPLPVSQCRSFGLSFTSREVSNETPPTAGLGEVLNLLVKYLNSGLVTSAEGTDQVGCSESPGCSGSYDVIKSRNGILSSENLNCSWNSQVQRPLYRFILRSFLFCPIVTSINNASQVFSLWTSYMEPWKTSPEEFVEFNIQGDPDSENLRKANFQFPNKSVEGKGGGQSERMYSPAWQGYVLSNYLFYSSLVVHFLGFAHKFLHSNVETVIQMVLKLLNILTSSKELTDLLKKIDVTYHSKSSGSSSAAFDSLQKYIPSIREQLQDWEDGLSEGDADGSFLHENWNRDLRLFADGEDGAHQLLQLLILRAESEIQAVSSDNLAQNLQTLDSIRAQMDNLFGGPVQKHSTPIAMRVDYEQNPHDEVFTPKQPGFGKRSWTDVKYQGDWMRRPISDSEVAWLARLLVRLSCWLNEVLGLNRIDENSSDPPGCPTYLEVPPNVQQDTTVLGAKEGLWMVLALLGSRLQAMLRLMRRRGIKINLRVFASKKFVTALIVYVVVSSSRKAFGLSTRSSSLWVW